MNIGLTYDLKSDYIKEGFSEEDAAEFDSEITVDTIASSLKKLGHNIEKIGNITPLVKALSIGKRWDIVFNICEGMYGIYSRESQVPSLLEAYNIPFTFSDSLTLSICLKKDLTKLIVNKNGFKTPDYCVVNKIEDLDNITLPYPLFVKPIAEGTSKGIYDKSKVTTKSELSETVIYLLSKFNQPVLIETFCSGREFTAGIIGTGKNSRYIGAIEVLLKPEAEQSGYSYKNKMDYENLVEYRLVDNQKINKEIEDFTLGIWQTLGCRDAGRIDIMLDSEDKLNFIEVNPLAGLNPLHSDLPILFYKLNFTYEELIKQIIDSALLRIGNNNK